MRLPAATLASVAVHAALLVLAAVTLLPTGHLVEFVRVSLRDGAGGRGGDGRGVGIPAAPPAPVPAAIPAAVKPKALPHRIARRSAAVLNRAINAAAAPAPVTDSVVVDAAGTTAAPSEGSVAVGGVGSGGTAGARGSGGDSDQRAYCVYCPEPGYPLIARRRGWQGTVDVGLALLADGRVESATVRRSSGYDTLDREAIDVARRSRFRLPDGSAAGAPVYGRIEYHFELVGPR